MDFVWFVGLGFGFGLFDGVCGFGDVFLFGFVFLVLCFWFVCFGLCFCLSFLCFGLLFLVLCFWFVCVMEFGCGGIEIVGKFEFFCKDLIGYGVFVVVFKGCYCEKYDLEVVVKCINKKNFVKF